MVRGAGRAARLRVGGLGCAILACLAGCGAAVCPVQTHASAGAALRALSSMRAHAAIVRAEARVDRRDAGGRIRGTVLMILERPDRVRFDAMTQFGPAATLTSDGSTFALMDLREERFYVGAACPSNISRLLGLPLSGADVALLLLGETPRIDAQEEDLACAGGAYRATLRDAGGRVQTIELDVRQADVQRPPLEQRLHLRRSEVRAADGSLEWRAEWSDYRFVVDPRSEASPPQGVSMPYRIHVELPARGIDTLVRFESIEIADEIPADAFVQEPRPGLEVEPVDCE